MRFTGARLNREEAGAMTGAKRRVLLVAQLAPPSPLIPARRIAGLAKYLSAEGLEVSVLTSRISGEGHIEGAKAVARTSDLMASPLNWRRAQFKALEGSGDGSYSRPSRLESVLVPDIAAATWLPFAVTKSLRLVRDSRLDCVITTGPAHSVHLVGLALRRRGIPWIAEFRDGWSFDQPARAFPLRAQRQLDAALERRVARGADALVAVTEPIADDLSRRFDRPATVLTNAFDPEEVADRGDSGLLDEDRFSVVHTGRMAYAGRSPVPLLEGVRLLKRDHPRAAARLEVVLAGPLSAEEEPLVRAADLADTVRAVGTLDRPRTLQLQHAADALLVLAEGSSRRVATGKLFEYLATDAPILVLGEGTEAARIVAETGAGFATAGSDPKLIAEGLERLVASPPDRARDPAAVEPYSYPHVAQRYAELIEDVVSRRERS
jgi:glycosyltransferase involved in cell wall biosynthesis